MDLLMQEEVRALAGARAGAGALSVVAVRLPGSPLGGVLMAGAVRHVPPAAQFRRALSPPAAGSPTCSGAARRPGEVSAPGLAVLLGPCAGWLPPVAWPWRGGAPPPAVSRAPPSSLEHTGAGPAPATPATSLPQPPPEKKAPWKPRQTRCRRCPCRAGSRRWLSWRSLPGGRALPGRTPAPHRHCRLSPDVVSRTRAR
jgi:hypothetical protein